MTTPSTGVIKFSDLQREFGGINPIKLSEYYSGGSLTPSGANGISGSIPSSSTIYAGKLRGAIKYSFLGETVGFPQGWDEFIGVAVDSGGFLYTAGRTSLDSGHGKGIITKYTPNGMWLWVKEVQSSVGTDTAELHNIKYDAATNCIYVSGRIDTYKAFLMKMDTDGNLIWQKTLLNGSTVSIFRSLEIDSSGNVYGVGYTSKAGVTGPVMFVAKYNSAGTLQFQRNAYTSGNTTESNNWREIKISGSNTYLVGESIDAGKTRGAVAKIDSTGAIVWQKSLTLSGDYVYLYGVDVDPSGNVYVCGQHIATSVTYGVIAKYDSSGVLQFKKEYSANSNSDIFKRITVDTSTNNLVVCGTTSASNNQKGLTALFASDGTAISATSVARSASPIINLFESMFFDNSDKNLYVAGKSLDSGGQYRSVLFSLPYSNITAPGLINIYNFGAITFTITTSSMVDATSSLTSDATSLTQPVATPTIAANNTSLSISQIRLNNYDTNWALTYHQPLGKNVESTMYNTCEPFGGDIFSVGYQASTTGPFGNEIGTTSAYITSMSPAGQINWKTLIHPTANSGDTISASVIKPDGLGNHYVHARWNQYASFDQKSVIFKIDADGGVTWQKDYGNEELQNTYGAGLAVDSLGNVYTTGIRTYTGSDTNKYNTIFLNKFNSSGVLQWQRGLKNDLFDVGDSAYLVHIAIDSSDNIVVASIAGDSVSSFYMNIAVASYNSSGTLNWQKKIAKASAYLFVNAITTDKYNNIYITGFESGTSAYMIKLPSTGASITWQKSYSTPSNVPLYSIKCDETGNWIYGVTNISQNGSIYKISAADGVLRWVKNFKYTSSGSSIYLQNVDYNVVDDILTLAGSVDANNNGQQVGLTMRLRQAFLDNNNSISGAVNFILSVSSYSTVTASYTLSAGIMTEYTPTLNANTRNFAVETAVLNPTKFTIET